MRSDETRPYEIVPAPAVNRGAAPRVSPKQLKGVVAEIAHVLTTDEFFGLCRNTIPNSIARARNSYFERMRDNGVNGFRRRFISSNFLWESGSGRPRAVASGDVQNDGAVELTSGESLNGTLLLFKDPKQTKHADEA